MAIVPLQKIRVFVPTDEADTLVGVLQDAGCMEMILDTEQTQNKIGLQQEAALTARHYHARIEMARTFFSYHHQEGVLRTMLEGARAYTSAAELNSLSKDSIVDQVITQVEKFQDQLAELERIERTVAEELHTLHAWERFELPLNTLTETVYTLTYALRGPERSLKKTLTSIQETIGSLHEIREVSITTALITFLKSDRNTVEELISAGGVEVVSLPQSGNTAAALLVDLEEKRRQHATSRIALTEAIRKAATEHLPLLQKKSDLSRWQLEKAETVANLYTTDRTTVVTAWAPKEQLSKITSTIESVLPIHAIELLEPTEIETIPTELQNKSWIQPFESVTRLYGAPFYRDLDPTPVLSLFFFIFFGFCLSDTGYGLILMLLTGLVLWRYHLDTGTKQIIKLLFYGGFGTVVAGILFGGYFGISALSLAEKYPALDFLITLQKFDPISDPMPVFFLALILGFVHVAFGIFLNLYRKISLGDTKNALLDDAPWLYLFLLVAVYLANTADYLRENIGLFLSENTTLFFSSAVLLIIITQGRTQKNFLMKIVSGILGLYGAVGYFADILSYSRLMALGLATGALAFSINSIALFVGGDSLGIGTIMMVVVLLFGHTLNIAISLLGTFINSARLQFVEFFSKFGTGTGRPFSPFYKETKHTIILSDSPPR